MAMLKESTRGVFAPETIGRSAQWRPRWQRAYPATPPERARPGRCKSRGLTLRSMPRNLLPPGDSAQRPGLIIANKLETATPQSIQRLRELYEQPEAETRLEVVAISTRLGEGLEELFTRLWKLLAMIRVYAKEPGKAPDLGKPFIVPLGATVEDLALQIHRDLPERLTFARLWGHSRFEGQQVHKTEILQDRDVVELHE